MRRRETWEGDLNLLRILRHDFLEGHQSTVVGRRVVWIVVLVVAAALLVTRIFVLW